MYSDKFSKDVSNFFRSPVREIFKRVDLNAIYSFAGGYPNASTFPLEQIKTLSGLVVDKWGASAFQYGATQGVPVLREAVAARYGVDVSNVQITTSSQQGIDVCARVLVDPGDVILTGNPTYLGALQSFRSYRADIVGVSDFKWEEAIQDCLSEGKKIKFLYMIPDFQNPTGETLTLEQRRVLVELAKKYDFLIVEDSPYRELRYEGEHLPTMYSLAPERVIHLGSFSKIFAPGFRLGWILAPQEVLDSIYVCKQSLDLCPPVFDQYMAAEFLSSGMLDKNLLKSIELYRSKRDHLLSLLEKYMPQGVSWTHPQGGLFLFLRLPEGFDSVAFYDKALDAGVAYVSGAFFYPAYTDKSKASTEGLNTMRLNFSFLATERMEPGIKLLSSLIKETI